MHTTRLTAYRRLTRRLTRLYNATDRTIAAGAPERLTLARLDRAAEMAHAAYRNEIASAPVYSW